MKKFICAAASFRDRLIARRIAAQGLEYRTDCAALLAHFRRIVAAFLRNCSRLPRNVPPGGCPVRQGHVPVHCGACTCARCLFRRPICHWIVGDPVALLRTSTRKGPLLDHARGCMHCRTESSAGWDDGSRMVRSYVMARELARAYPSPRTIATVSSTVQESEFSPRNDTCQGPRQCASFLWVTSARRRESNTCSKPSASLTQDVPWELEIVGPDQFPNYRPQLDEIGGNAGHSRPRALDRIPVVRQASV